MKNFKEFIKEENDQDSLPQEIVDKWEKLLKYDFKLKKKFNYFDVTFRSENLTKGYKSHVTRYVNKLTSLIKQYNLDTEETLKKLQSSFPSKHF